MKYAIKYYQECRALPDADEIIIKYYERSVRLLDFIQTLSENQRLIDLKKSLGKGKVIKLDLDEKN